MTIIYTTPTPGLGNLLFQFFYGKILEKKINGKFFYPEIKSLGIKGRDLNKIDKNKKILNVDYKNRSKLLLEPEKYKKFDYIFLNDFFEDYKLFSDELEYCKTFIKPKFKNKTRYFTIHLRLQNRLVQKNNFANLLKVEFYEKLINQNKDLKLKIVTDLFKWEKYSKKDILDIHLQTYLGLNPGAKRVKIDESLSYVNTLIESLNKFNPEVILPPKKFIPGGGGMSMGQKEAFLHIMNSERIFIHNSTFSWWAAALGEPKKVYIYEPWKPYKVNPKFNLGKTNYVGWYQIGKPSDTIYSEKIDKNFQKKDFSSALFINRFIKLLRLCFKVNSFRFKNHI